MSQEPTPNINVACRSVDVVDMKMFYQLSDMTKYKNQDPIQRNITNPMKQQITRITDKK